MSVVPTNEAFSPWPPPNASRTASATVARVRSLLFLDTSGKIEPTAVLPSEKPERLVVYRESRALRVANAWGRAVDYVRELLSLPDTSMQSPNAPTRAHLTVISLIVCLGASAVACVVTVTRLGVARTGDASLVLAASSAADLGGCYAAALDELVLGAQLTAGALLALGVWGNHTASTLQTTIDSFGSVDGVGLFNNATTTSYEVARNSTALAATAVRQMYNSTCLDAVEEGEVAWDVVSVDTSVFIGSCLSFGDGNGLAVALDRRSLDGAWSNPSSWGATSHVLLLDSDRNHVFSSSNADEPHGSLLFATHWFLRGVGQAMSEMEPGGSYAMVFLERQYVMELAAFETASGWSGEAVLLADWTMLTDDSEGNFDRTTSMLSVLTTLCAGVTTALALRMRGLMGTQSQRLRELDSAIADCARDLEQSKVASAWKTEIIMRMYFAVREPLLTTLRLADKFLQKPGVVHSERIHGAVLDLKTDASVVKSLFDSAFDMARLDLDQFEVNARQFNLQQLVEECVYSFLPLASAKEVDLVVDCPLDPTWIEGDCVRVEQLLASLLCNAVRHVDSGYIAVIAGVYDLPDGGTAMTVIVEDTGCGINASQLAALQAQLSQPVRDLRNETQIGLAMARHIVEQLDGTVTLTSVLGHGTTVSFMLPISLLEHAPPPQRPPPAAAGTGLVELDGEINWGALVGLRVLLVYEGDHHRAVVASQLRKHGIVVEETGVWQQAELLLTNCERPYGVVIISRPLVSTLFERTEGSHYQDDRTPGFSRRSAVFDTAITPLSVLSWVFRFDPEPPNVDWVRRTGFDMAVRCIMPSVMADLLRLWLKKNGDRVPNRTMSERRLGSSRRRQQHHNSGGYQHHHHRHPHEPYRAAAHSLPSTSPIFADSTFHLDPGPSGESKEDQSEDSGSRHSSSQSGQSGHSLDADAHYNGLNNNGLTYRRGRGLGFQVEIVGQHSIRSLQLDE